MFPTHTHHTIHSCKRREQPRFFLLSYKDGETEAGDMRGLPCAQSLALCPWLGSGPGYALCFCCCQDGAEMGWIQGQREALVELPAVANKNTRCPVKCEFQINAIYLVWVYPKYCTLISPPDEAILHLQLEQSLEKKLSQCLITEVVVIDEKRFGSLNK